MLLNVPFCVARSESSIAKFAATSDQSLTSLPATITAVYGGLNVLDFFNNHATYKQIMDALRLLLIRDLQS
jgi:hypothetical protein